MRKRVSAAVVRILGRSGVLSVRPGSAHGDAQRRHIPHVIGAPAFQAPDDTLHYTQKTAESKSNSLYRNQLPVSWSDGLPDTGGARDAFRPGEVSGKYAKMAGSGRIRCLSGSNTAGAEAAAEFGISPLPGPRPAASAVYPD